jgi:very-short-patch-repair endonuclease
MTDHPRRHTEATKKKIGDSRRGKKMPEEYVAAMTERVRANHPKPMLGRKHSEESLQKMRDAARSRRKDPIQEANRIEGVRRAHSNKPKSDDQRNKIRNGVLAYIGREGANWQFANTKGERQIAQYLADLGYSFQQQYVFQGHSFDFYVPDLHLIIEFDGTHHWDIPWFEKDITKHPELLALQKAKDDHWSQMVINAGYRIVRVKGRHEPGDSHHGTLLHQLCAQGIILTANERSCS